MAELISPHIIEVPVMVILIIELFALLYKDLPICCQVQMQDDSRVALALILFFVRESDRARKHCRIFQSSFVIANAFEIMVDGDGSS
jgi:hypothetical protein